MHSCLIWKMYGAVPKDRFYIVAIFLIVRILGFHLFFAFFSLLYLKQYFFYICIAYHNFFLYFVVFKNHADVDIPIATNRDMKSCIILLIFPFRQ